MANHNTLLSPELLARVEGLYGSCAFEETLCGTLGISKSCWQKWKRWGHEEHHRREAGQPPLPSRDNHVRLLLLLRRLRPRTAADALARVKSAAESDSKLACWLSERHHLGLMAEQERRLGLLDGEVRGLRLDLTSVQAELAATRDALATAGDELAAVRGELDTLRRAVARQETRGRDRRRHRQGKRTMAALRAAHSCRPAGACAAP